MRITQKNKQQGFGMIELLAFMIVGLILVAGVQRGFIVHLDVKRTELTAGQIQTVMDAATSYLEDKSQWPDQGNRCRNAISVLGSNKYLGGVNAQTAWGRSGDSGGNGYISTSCNSDTNPPYLTATVTLSSTRWAQYLAKSLNNATISGRTVTVYATRSQVLAAKGDVSIEGMTYVSNDDNQIPKPSCPGNYEPALFGANAGFAKNYKAPNVGAEFIRVTYENSSYWRVQLQVTSEGETTVPTGEYSPMLMIITCKKKNASY